MRAGYEAVGLGGDVRVESSFLVDTRHVTLSVARGKKAKGGTSAVDIVRVVNLGNAAAGQVRDGQLNAVDVLGAL